MTKHLLILREQSKINTKDDYHVFVAMLGAITLINCSDMAKYFTKLSDY